MLGSLILNLKGMRTTMFQLSGFYCRVFGKSLTVANCLRQDLQGFFEGYVGSLG